MDNQTVDPVNSGNDSDISLPCELQNLTTLLDNSLETLALGNPEIEATALTAAKHIFELSVDSEGISRPHVVDLVSSLAPWHAPRTRSKTKAEAGKPSQETIQQDFFDYTPLNTLFIDGMDDEQIWAQLDLRTQTICRMLDSVLEGETEPCQPGEQSEDGGEEDDDDDDERLQEALEALKRDENIDIDEFLARYGLDEDGIDDSQDDSSKEGSPSQSDSDHGGDEEMGEDISPLRDPSSEDERDSNLEFDAAPRKVSKKRKRGESELDDGFFDLAEFNTYTKRAEAKSSSRGRLAGSDSDENDEEIDIFAGIDSNVNLENDGRDLYYRDFFEPPSKDPGKSKSNNNSQVRFHEDVRVKKIKATGNNRSLHDEDMDDYIFDEENDSDSENDLDESDKDLDVEKESDNSDESEEGSVEEPEDEGTTIERLKQDLFAEEEEKQDDTTIHEKRMEAIRGQIAQLESENVAPKEWLLMGEAGSRQRPKNSLLEEDLDFERVRKTAPVITEEVVHSLEERIKARILEGQFDDVVRIKPLDDKPFLPSRLFELQDTKSTQSLAQIYEAEYLASQEGGPLTDDRDGKLRKEHDEITRLWDKVCNKLDALSNAHFVPKQPKATISTVENVATVLMESALPTSKSAATMLAPEEVFSKSTSSLKVPSELTSAEKRARRTKERKLRKHQRDALDQSVDKFANSHGVKKRKQAALDSLVKHGRGVTVVGKESISRNKRKKR